MNILALETSGNLCSVSLNSGQITYQKTIEAVQKQGEFLLPMVQEALTRSKLTPQDIQLIAFDAGPGSFTGVRLNTAVAQGLSMGWNKPLIPVCSLQALAYKLHQEKALNPIAVCLDARKQEIYVGGYHFHPNVMRVILPEQVIAPSKLVSSLEIHGPLPAPLAIDILHFAQYRVNNTGYKLSSFREIQPIYLRNKVTD